MTHNEERLARKWAHLEDIEPVIDQFIKAQQRPCFANVAGVIVSANSAFARLIGVSDPADLVGTDGIAKFIAPLSHRVARAHVAHRSACPYQCISDTPDPHHPYLVELEPHLITWRGHPARLLFVSRLIDIKGEPDGTIHLDPRPTP